MTKGHFEAKKHAYRQTQDGIVVSFVIHPNDLDAQFAIAPLGTRYMVGFAEIGDDGKPLGVAKLGALTPLGLEREAKERRKFGALPLSQQAALRCGDAMFQEFMLVKTAEDAAEKVRRQCRVDTRSHIVYGTPAGALWLQLESQYQDWVTDRNFAEARR